MKYLKKFETEAEKTAWLGGSEFVTPNVVLTGDVVGYNLEIDYSLLPLHIEALKDLTVKFSNSYEYSKDNATWLSGTSDTSISANAGEKVYFRASGLTPNSSYGIGNFTISSGSCNIAGNIMSMLYGADYHDKLEITQSYAFSGLFTSQRYIKSASKLVLPATTLSSCCYYKTFYDCTNLVDAPSVLPATVLEDSCYAQTFMNCSSLLHAPEMLARTLAPACCESMYKNCTSLVDSPPLLAETLVQYCYRYMFENTALVEAPAILAKTLANFCCVGMFRTCKKLVRGPELLPKSLVQSCYAAMFYNSSLLSYVKALFTTTPTISYTDGWLGGVASTGIFVKNSAATWNVTGSYGIPSGWTVETADA